jgi:hypothetical protein
VALDYTPDAHAVDERTVKSWTNAFAYAEAVVDVRLRKPG